MSYEEMCPFGYGCDDLIRHDDPNCPGVVGYAERMRIVKWLRAHPEMGGNDAPSEMADLIENGEHLK